MEIITFASTSNVLRIKILDSASTTGAGKTGLLFSSAGLIISTIADNEATATAYTQAGSTIETIATLGTYAAPTATKCRFKEVDATNHPGVYEIQIADARYAVAAARRLLVSISGAAGMVQVDKVIELKRVDLQDGVRGGMTALPNAAANATSGLYVIGGTGVNLTKWNNVNVAGSVAGFPVVSANNLEAQALIDVLAALTGATNTIAVDVNHRVKSLDSGGNTFTNLQDLYTGSGTNAKFTVPALSNAPTGAGGGTNVNVVSLSAGALAQIAGTGTGDTNVDHSSLDVNGDNLLVEEMGEGLGSATVDAYLKSEWDANQSAAVLRGRTSTRDDGTWVDSLRLFSGLTYYVKAYRQGDTEKMTKTVLVP